MAFVDEVTIRSRAGNGGNGVVRWLREKSRPWGGPAGGNGGRGGDVVVRGVRDLGRLTEYRFVKEVVAENGEAGKSKNQDGKDGATRVLEVPIGSVVSVDGTPRVEVLEEGKDFLLLRGGAGGLGNAYFKGAENQNPQESTPGKPGEAGLVHIELKLIVDCGFVGLPNAGKSSLLNALTNARSKVGAYPFTTLEPNLGDYHGYVLADIPGLIEGASDGKGLGHRFLRHVSRTKVLLHLVSLEEEDPVSAYRAIRDELAAYSEELAAKPEALVLTKTDTAPAERLEEVREALSKVNSTITDVSIIDDEALARFKGFLSRYLGGTATPGA